MIRERTVAFGECDSTDDIQKLFNEVFSGLRQLEERINKLESDNKEVRNPAARPETPITKKSTIKKRSKQ